LVRDLGRTPAAILEQNGHLFYAPTQALRFVEHFDQERVPIREYGIQIEGLEYLASIAAKSGSAIHGPQAKNCLGKRIGTPTQDLAWQRAPGSATSPHVSGADHQIAHRTALFKHVGYVAWMMREIGIHGHDSVIVSLQGMLEASYVGRPQP
jgi:hypothetical protein